MNHIFEVTRNLVIYSVILYIVIKILSKVFDVSMEKIAKTDTKVRKGMILGIVVIGALIPLMANNQPYMLRTAVVAMIYIVLALSLNLILGFTGQLSMGHSAFYGIGAYTMALLTVKAGFTFWTALLCSAVMAAFFGLILGIPTLRLRGDYLAITTIGFGEILRLILVNWTDFTEGPAGIPGIPSPSIFGMKIVSSTGYYYIIYIIVILVVIISSRLLNSRLGRGLTAIRDDEIAAEAMGVNSTKLKILAFVLGAAIAGVAGGFFGSFIHYVNPDNFNYAESVIILTMVVLGGVGSIPGVIIGAIVLAILPEVLRDMSTYRYAIYGLLLVMMMIIRPKGMISADRVKRRDKDGSFKSSGNDKAVRGSDSSQ